MELMDKLQYGKNCTIPAVPGAPPLILDEVDFGYPGAPRLALDGVSITVERGEMVALVGPNGAGKSTLLKVVVGIETVDSGHVSVYGHPPGKCRHRVGYVPQRGDVDWRFPVSVREVVMMGRYPSLGWLRWPRPADHAAVDHALEALGIADLADKQIGELSGGQQQRVMLARIVAHQAELLLLDEPLNNLDMPAQELIFHLLQDMAAQGHTVVISTHDLGLLYTHFSRAIFLDGHVVADGPIHEILTPEMLARAYGVPLHFYQGQIPGEPVR